MQSLNYRVEHYFDDQGPGLVQHRRVEGDRIEDALLGDIEATLGSSWCPAKGEWLVFSADHRPRHAPLGVDTLPVSARLLHRACERLWPTGEPCPDPARRAAYCLLQSRHAVIRHTPAGLVASRY